MVFVILNLILFEFFFFFEFFFSFRGDIHLHHRTVLGAIVSTTDLIKRPVFYSFPSCSFIMDALNTLTDHQRSVLEQYQVSTLRN